MEVCDFRRFASDASAPAFMALLGLVPSERSSGSRRWQRATKTGHGHLRRHLVEAALHYRHSYAPSKISSRAPGYAGGADGTHCSCRAQASRGPDPNDRSLRVPSGLVERASAPYQERWRRKRHGDTTCPTILATTPDGSIDPITQLAMPISV